MNNLDEILQITNSNGEVITLFDGKVTLGQVIAGVVALIFVVVILKTLRGATRMLMFLFAVVVCALYLGVVSPTQIKDATAKIQETGMDFYEKMAITSDKVRIANKEIQVNIEGTWISVTEIESFVVSSDGVVTVNFGGQCFSTDDTDIVALLRTFK